MKIKTRLGNSPSVLVNKKLYGFKHGMCELSDKEAIEVMDFTGRDYERVDNKLLSFNPESWIKHKRVFYETSVAPANGFGKAGTYITMGLNRYADVCLVDSHIMGWDRTQIPKEIFKMHQKKYEPIDSFYIQSKVISGMMNKSYSSAQIIRTMFETNKIRKEWVDYLNKKSIAVLVPCKTQKDVFVKCGVKRPVYILPDAVDYSLYPPNENINKRSDSGFVFGMEGSLSYRKGGDLAVKAFQKAFSKDKYPNVFLYIKTRKNYSYPFGKVELKNGNVIINDDDRIIVNNENLKHDDLIKQFYHSIDAYLFLSRGEGFSLTTAQAMGMGIPIIGSNCSGVREQLKNGRGYLVKTRLVDVPDNKMYSNGKLIPATRDMPSAGYDEFAQVEGHQWWEADIDDAVSKMRFLYNNYNDAIKKAELARNFAIKNYSINAVGKKLYNILNKIYAYSEQQNFSNFIKPD